MNQIEKELTEIIDEIDQLHKKRKYRLKLRKIVFIICVICSLIPLSFYIILGSSLILLVIAGLYIIALITYPIIIGPKIKEINDQIEILKKRKELYQQSNKIIERRAENLFISHETTLRRYYYLANSKNNLFFIFGLLSIMIGFAIIVFSITLIYLKPEFKLLGEENGNKAFLPILGMISGILSIIAGLIFLRLFSSSLNLLNIFHKEFALVRNLYFANILISKIESKDSREAILADIAKNITSRYSYGNDPSVTKD